QPRQVGDRGVARRNFKSTGNLRRNAWRLGPAGRYIVVPESKNWSRTGTSMTTDQKSLDPSAAAPVEADKHPHHASFGARIRRYFLTGLVVVGPALITGWLLWWFASWVDGIVRPFIPWQYRPETYLPVKIPGFGLIIAFVTLTFIGFVTANYIG